MKTLKLMLSGIAMLLVFVAGNATAKPVADKPTKTDVVNMYIDAVAHGKSAGIEQVISDDILYNIQRGENTTTLGKADLVAFLKSSTADDSVKISTDLLEDSDDASLIQIEFKYADYTRVDKVAMNKTSGWLITNIVTSTK